MKKTMKITAAAMAAVLAMTGSAFGAFAEDETSDEAPIVSEEFTGMISGGWSVNEGKLGMKFNPGAKAAFTKATSGIERLRIQPVALLSTQIVAGTNYCFLCRVKETGKKNSAVGTSLVYVYEDLTGNASVTGYKTIIGEALPGGFFTNTGKVSLSANKDVYKAYKKAMNGLTGVSYTPVAYLGSQVVAGTNYLILCRSRVVYPNAPYKFSLVTIYKDLSGKSEVLDIEDIVFGETDEMQDIDYDKVNDNLDGVANPWSEYETLAAAGNAAGVSFDAPDALGKYKLSGIRAMKGMIDVDYSNGKKEICARKGTGTDDISGDYNEYEKTERVKISGVKVTLRLNGDKVGSAIWTDGKNSYAYYVEGGIARKTALSHIKALIGK